jgi:hypothetical protein
VKQMQYCIATLQTGKLAGTQEHDVVVKLHLVVLYYAYVHHLYCWYCAMLCPLLLLYSKTLCTCHNIAAADAVKKAQLLFAATVY